MRKNRKVGVLFCSLWTAVSLGACSAGATKIYADNHMNAVVRNEDEEKVLAVDVDLTSKAPALSEFSMDALTLDGTVKSYEVQLSDGTIYGYQDDTMDHGTETYAKVFKSMEELSDTLDRSLLQSNENVYPEGENNFLLIYDKTQDNITIHAAQVAAMENFKVKWDVLITFTSDKSSRNTFNIYDVTDRINHETYTSQNGLQTELFWDADTGKAGICVLEEGMCYTWELDGKVDEESVKAYADTIS